MRERGTECDGDVLVATVPAAHTVSAAAAACGSDVVAAVVAATFVVADASALSADIAVEGAGEEKERGGESYDDEQ